MQEEQSMRLQGLDYLRGLASISVVFYHYFGLIHYYNIQTNYSAGIFLKMCSYGFLGVPAFFIISGYVIALTGSKIIFEAKNAVVFFVKRFVRIYPPYAIYILIFSGVIFVGKKYGKFSSTSLDFLQLSSHFLFLQDLLNFRNISVQTWTLCLEVQFYLFYCLLSFVMHGRLRKYFDFVIVFSMFLSLACSKMSLISDSIFFPYWYQFAFGVCLFRKNSFKLLDFFLIIFLLFQLFLGLVKWRLIDVSFSFVAYLVFFSLKIGSGELKIFDKVFGFFGKISYSLYLFHGLVGLPLDIIFRQGFISSSTAAFIVIWTFVFISVFASWIYWLLIEKRFVEISKLVTVYQKSALSAD